MDYPFIRMAFLEIDLDNGMNPKQETIDKAIENLSFKYDLYSIEKYFSEQTFTILLDLCTGERGEVEQNIIEPGGEIAKKADEMLGTYFNDYGCSVGECPA